MSPMRDGTGQTTSKDSATQLYIGINAHVTLEGARTECEDREYL